MGYSGSYQILRVNLTTRKIDIEEVFNNSLLLFSAGRGLAIDYLYKELTSGVDPLGEANKLVFSSGFLAGTNAQSVSRSLVCTKSPLTDCYGRASVGGDIGAWLRFAGYIGVIVEGKAEKPVYLLLNNGNCQVIDAADLWGLDTQQTQEQLRSLYGSNIRVACIGPAGEKLIKYAAIVNGRRTASRCGVGAVMGSKNLKALAVIAERNRVVADPETFSQLVKNQIQIYQGSKDFERMKAYGTTNTAMLINRLGAYPTRNYRYGRLEGFEKLSGDMYRKFRTGDSGCYSCAMRCGKKHKVVEGPYAGAASEGPEYESIQAFTGSIENTNIEFTIAADQMCDDLGLDTISTGNCIGFAFELYEKGLLSKQDVDGLDLSYGNHNSMLALIKKIAMREGIGNLLAEGAMRFAEKVGHGSQDYAIHSKGLELPAYEPRGLKSMGFNFATSNIGGSHCYGYSRQETYGVTLPRQVDRFAEEENVDIVIYNQNYTAMAEMGVICAFAQNLGWVKDLFPRMLVAATGIKELGDMDYLLTIGERIVNLERVFNVRDGFSRKDDTLPKRMLDEPLHTLGSPGEGQKVANLEKVLDLYYQMRGWQNNGIPSAQKLNLLGLKQMVSDAIAAPNEGIDLN